MYVCVCVCVWELVYKSLEEYLDPFGRNPFAWRTRC